MQSGWKCQEYDKFFAENNIRMLIIGLCDWTTFQSKVTENIGQDEEMGVKFQTKQKYCIHRR